MLSVKLESIQSSGQLLIVYIWGFVSLKSKSNQREAKSIQSLEQLLPNHIFEIQFPVWILFQQKSSMNYSRPLHQHNATFSPRGGLVKRKEKDTPS